MNLEEIKSQTTWNDAARSLNSNFASLDVEIEKLRHATIKNKGYFPSATALAEAFPNAQDGDMAFVGYASPFAVYVWDSATASWVDSGEVVEEGAVDLGNYYTKSEIDAKSQALSAGLDSLGNRVATAENDITLLRETKADKTEHNALVSEFTAAKKEIQQNISSLETRIDSNAELINTNSEDILVLDARVTESEREVRKGKSWEYPLELNGMAGTEEAYAVDIPAGNGFVLKTAVSGLDSVSGATLKFVTGGEMPYLIEEDFNPAGYERTFSMGYDVKGILVGFGNMDAGEMTLLVNQTSFAMDADLQSFRAQIYNVVTKDEYKALVANNQVVEERLYFVLEE